MVFSVSQWPFRCDRDLFGNVRVGRVYVRVSRDHMRAGCVHVHAAESARGVGVDHLRVRVFSVIHERAEP